MSTDILLLGILIGMTILAYMIAINSHGSTRLLVSYLLATILLAGTVWFIIQYVNAGENRVQQEEFRRLENEKLKAEERVRNQEQTISQNRKMIDAAAKINSMISLGNGYASSMINAELKDFSLELEALISRANMMKTNIDSLQNNFSRLKEEISLFPESGPIITEALGKLSEAVKYYRLYFYSETSTQEEQRATMIRQKAKESIDLFKKAGSLVVVKL